MVDASTSSGYGANRDLVVAGALLHDIGTDSTVSLHPEMTVEGTVTTTLFWGIIVFLVWQRILTDEKYAAALGHTIVSHHGQGICLTCGSCDSRDRFSG